MVGQIIKAQDMIVSATREKPTYYAAVETNSPYYRAEMEFRPGEHYEYVEKENKWNAAEKEWELVIKKTWQDYYYDKNTGGKISKPQSVGPDGVTLGTWVPTPRKEIFYESPKTSIKNLLDVATTDIERDETIVNFNNLKHVLDMVLAAGPQEQLEDTAAAEQLASRLKQFEDNVSSSRSFEEILTTLENEFNFVHDKKNIDTFMLKFEVGLRVLDSKRVDIKDIALLDRLKTFYRKCQSGGKVFSKYYKDAFDFNMGWVGIILAVDTQIKQLQKSPFSENLKKLKTSLATLKNKLSTLRQKLGDLKAKLTV